MSNAPLNHPHQPTPKPGLRAKLAQGARSVLGLAQDFWKDGKESPLRFNHPKAEPFDLSVLQSYETSAEAQAARARYGDDPRAPRLTAEGLWQAMPGEIAEKMWGRDAACPGDDALFDTLLAPLDLHADMTLLDLSAGLGGRLRRAVQSFNLYATGLESDTALAERGMALSLADGTGKRASIQPYDPAHLTPLHRYDAAVAREMIYRVDGKEKFMRAIVDCLKPKAQIALTDYIVNPESRDHPAILAWQAYEPEAHPPGLVEMAELWARAGVDLRAHEDLTDFYKKEITAGLMRLAKFMASGVRPDSHTKQAINHRITLWAHRVAAIEGGMKFYRFHGVR